MWAYVFTRSSAATRSLTHASTHSCAQERIQATTAEITRPPRYHQTSENGTASPAWRGISTRSTSGMVR
jgi:hypothetical protein